jgi:hypothetical protein
VSLSSELTIVVTNLLPPDIKMSEYIFLYLGSKILRTCVEPGVYATAPNGNKGRTIVPFAPLGSRSGCWGLSLANHLMSGGASSSGVARRCTRRSAGARFVGGAKAETATHAIAKLARRGAIAREWLR